MKSRILLFCLFLSSAIHAQLNIRLTKDPDSLVKKVLVGKLSNVEIENVKYSGYRNAVGLFRWKLKYNTIIPKGIILATGTITNALGPNNTQGASHSSTNAAVDEDIKLLTKEKTFDGAVLEFDFMVPSDSVSFNYFFASEEYPEYVDKGVNDVFGFFLIDSNSMQKTNLAVLQPGNLPIAVDNINDHKNSDRFISIGTAYEGELSAWRNNMKAGELAYDMQYDGMTTLLHAGAKVIPFHKYHLKMSIADVGDDQYDSAIFIEAESFKSVGIPQIDPRNPGLIEDQPKEKALVQLVGRLFDKQRVEQTDSGATLNLKIGFDFNTAVIKDQASYALLDNIVKVLEADVDAALEIQGHTDQDGSVEYNQKLSLRRANEVARYLIAKGIDPNRIKTMGYGATKPLSATDKAENRRVVFLFTH